MKLVVIGDFHIPSRAKEIPNWIIETIKKEKPNLILCTGDVEIEDVITSLKRIADVICVRGNMDWLNLPEHQEIRINDIVIGLIHGTGIHPRGDLEQLNEYAKRMNANVLIHGHTHKMNTSIYKNKLFVNPGTATGVWGGSSSGGPESFIIMDINDNKIKLKKFIGKKEEVERYDIKNGEIRIHKD